MALGLRHAMPYGKHKGDIIEDVLKTNPGYLLWMRDAKKSESGNAAFFSKAVLSKLNEVIAGSKTLRKQFTEWKIDGEIEPETKEEILAALKADKVAGKVAEKVQEEAAVNYQQWGAF